MTEPQGTDCTILLATYNRPAMLAQQLRYLAGSGFSGPISVFDSSEGDAAGKNAATAAEFSAAAYFHLPPSTPVFSKFACALSSASTPYCVLLPDDDFLLVERLPDIIKALDSDSDAVAAHGRYFGYFTHGRTVQITDLIQSGAHLDQADGPARVLALMTGYEALTYAVCKTGPAQRAFAAAEEQKSILAQELLAGTALAAIGKVLRLDFLTHGRRDGSSLGYRQWHPMEWAAVDPAGLLSAYGPYRTALLRIIRSQNAGLDMDNAARSIDLAHLAYLSRYLDADVLADAAARDVAKMGPDGVVEAAWDVWAAKRGPSWLKPLRNGNPLSRGLRRIIRKLGLRYRSPRRPKTDEHAIETGEAGISITSVRVGAKFFEQAAASQGRSISESDLGLVAHALALRESHPSRPIRA